MHKYTGDIQIDYPCRRIVHNNVSVILNDRVDWVTAAACLESEFRTGLQTDGVYSTTITKEE